jgi:uncharacterized membrane protein YhdT
MTFRITGRECRWLRRLKLCYLVPIVMIIYLPLCLLEGISANPLSELWEDLKTDWRR